MAFLSHYEPLRFDGGGYGVGPNDLIRRSFDAMSPSGEGFTQYDVRLSTTEQLWFNVEVTNDGPLPITLTTLPALPKGAAGFSFDEVRIGPAGTGQPMYERSNAVPLTSVEMAARERRYLWIRGTFRGCWEVSSGTGFGTIPMTFRVLGMSRSQAFVLPFTISARPDHDTCA
jgi:hypothetical protein